MRQTTETQGTRQGLSEQKQHQETDSNETPQDEGIPPPLGANLSNQRIHPGDFARSAHDPPIDTSQGLALDAKVLIDSVGLAQHAVHHVMALVEVPALFEHVFRLGGGGVRRAVGVDVGAHVREQVGAVARLGDGGIEALEFAAVVGEDFAVAGEVALFQGGGGEGRFGIEEASELGD